MANVKQASSKRMKMAERAQQQLELHFPDAPKALMWSRKTNHGFTTLPRTLPLVMQAVDDQSKGQPAGHTLFCLWARSPDHPLVTIEAPAVFAAEAGFEGDRLVDTWRRRMRKLNELGLLKHKKGASGDFHYVLLLNPNAAMEYMYQAGLVQKALYSRFLDRLVDIGGYGELEGVRRWMTDNAPSATAKSAAPTAPNPPVEA